MSNRERVHAAGVLLLTRSRPRKFLLMKHAHRWDVPKGHAEPGETDRQTALRELTEETGLGEHQVELEEGFRFHVEYPVVYQDKPGQVFQKQVTFFLGWLDQPVSIECTEHLDYRWFDWQPPHRIQSNTIDPLLSAVERYLQDLDPQLTDRV